MITNTKFYKNNKEDIAVGLASGLAFGLAFGLVFGLAFGLVSGLAFGLLSGLAFGLLSGLVFELVFELLSGLAFGLVSGLAFGLVSGLAVISTNFIEALPFLTFYPILFLILGIFVLIEIFYWLDKEKPKKKVKTSFVLRKKFEATCEVLLSLSLITQIYILIREGIKYISKELLLEIVKWIGYIGVGLIGIGVLVGLIMLWLELNKLKYRK